MNTFFQLTIDDKGYCHKFKAGQMLNASETVTRPKYR